ncbi:hypothetical protein BGZ65_005179, partial [Modicella reniformis]
MAPHLDPLDEDKMNAIRDRLSSLLIGTTRRVTLTLSGGDDDGNASDGSSSSVGSKREVRETGQDPTGRVAAEMVKVLVVAVAVAVVLIVAVAVVVKEVVIVMVKVPVPANQQDCPGYQ